MTALAEVLSAVNPYERLLHSVSSHSSAVAAYYRFGSKTAPAKTGEQLFRLRNFNRLVCNLDRHLFLDGTNCS